MELRLLVLLHLEEALSTPAGAIDRALPPIAGPAHPAGRRAWGVVAGVLTLFAFAIRSTHFGNPVVHVDEAFYLLVGDRMLHGAVPYVDLWDRKPVGLFVLYAGIRLLGGNGILQYQIVATLFAAATAFCLARIAARFAGLVPATIAGAAYILWLGLFGGEGGQSPTFYNLLTALAAMATIHPLVDRPGEIAPIRRGGAMAMAIVGVGIAIKPNIMFEGIFFALMLLWAGWRAAPRPLPRLADAALWVALALLPMAMSLVWFRAIGAFDAFFYANFVSVLNRNPVPAAELAMRVIKILGTLSGFLICLAVALWQGPWRTGTPAGAAHRFALWWSAAATLGFLVFGTYYNHYALPLLLPIGAAMAPAFGWRHGRWRLGLVLAISLLVGGTIAYRIRAKMRLTHTGDAHYILPLAAIVRRNLDGGSLYVEDGETMLYHLTGARIPTRWLFPNHLNTGVENGAIGVVPQVEVRRIFERERPTVVVAALGRVWDLNYDSLAVTNAALRRDYRLIYTYPIDEEYRAVFVRLPGR